MTSSNLFDLLNTDVLDNKGEKTAMATLKGKPVALYFSAHWCPPCQRMTPLLAAVYDRLKDANKPFEIIFVSFDSDEESFKEYFNSMPWKAIAFESETRKEIGEKLGVESIPTLFVYDSEGKFQTVEGTEAVLRGVEAYPFDEKTIEQIEKIEAQRKAERLANLTLESLFTTADRNYVIDTKNQQISVASLKENEVIGIYFSAHWCPPCRVFTPKLAKIYEELRASGKSFQVVFVSSDRGETDFKEYFNEMPWLALPYQDRASKAQLGELFDVQGIPTLVLVNGNGKLLTVEGRSRVSAYGAKGWPFTPERIQELQIEDERAMAAYPKQITDPRHEHPLDLFPSVYAGNYVCNGCSGGGSGYAYHCSECNFDLHVSCAPQTK